MGEIRPTSRVKGQFGLNMLFLPRLREISRTPGWIFIKLGTGVPPPGVDEWIRFWARSAQRQGVKGQCIWYKYAIFTLFTQNLKNPLVDFHQTWHRGALPGVDELIRFWARSAQCQGSKVNEFGIKYAIFTSFTQNLKNPWVDFHQTRYRGNPPRVDELIRFWARSAQCQRVKGQ